MSVTSTEHVEIINYKNISHFPNLKDGKINIVQFIKAIENLVNVVDNIGHVFAPVKYDMQGNIDKVKKSYVYDGSTCLLDAMRWEIESGKLYAAEGILWLNRALLFFEIMYQEILKCVKNRTVDVNMKYMVRMAYDGSVKKYHNWVAQKLASFLTNLAPNLTHIIRMYQVNEDFQDFETTLEEYITNLHSVRYKIDEFFISKKLFNGT